MLWWFRCSTCSLCLRKPDSARALPLPVNPWTEDTLFWFFRKGRRTQDGTLSPFQAGIGLLAANLNIPVVPIRIDGLFELKKAGKMVARPGAVSVTIGKAVRFAAGTDPLKIAQDLEVGIKSL